MTQSLIIQPVERLLLDAAQLQLICDDRYALELGFKPCGILLDQRVTGELLRLTQRRFNAP